MTRRAWCGRDDRLPAGNLVYRQDGWRRAWRALEEWTRDLPEEMAAITTTVAPPPMMQMGDEPLLLIGFAWASPDRTRRRGTRRGAAGSRPAGHGGGRRGPVGRVAVGVRRLPKGVRAYWRNPSFDRLDDDVIDVLVGAGIEQTWVGTAFDVHHLGGAYGRVPEDGTPFPTRDARFWINIDGFWATPRTTTPGSPSCGACRRTWSRSPPGASTSTSRVTSSPGIASSTHARSSGRRSTTGLWQ